MLVFNALDDSLNEDGLAIQLLLWDAAENAEDAANFATILQSKKHIIPMNVMIADQHEAMILEIALDHVVTRKAAPGSSWLVSSNYFKDKSISAWNANCERYNALANAAIQHHGKVNPNIIKKALYDARIKELNIQAIIFKPEDMEMFLSINKKPASKGPYIKLDLKSLFIRPEFHSR